MKYKLILTSLILSFLSGCTSIENRPTDIQSPDDGLMVVSVLENSPRKSSLEYWSNASLTAVNVTKKGEPETEFIANEIRTDAATRTTLYAMSLPEGEYKVTSFSTDYCGVNDGFVMSCHHGFYRTGEDFTGKFKIKAGQLTDLGLIINTNDPLHTFDRTSYDLSQPALSSLKLINRFLPEYEELTNSTSLGWLPNKNPKSMSTAFNYAKANSQGFVSPTELNDGSLLYGSANGMLFKWHPKSQPVGIDVGERKSIESLLVTSTNQWLVGGELGLLKITNDQGKSWQSVSGNLPFGITISLLEWNGKVISTILKGSKVYIHTTTIGDSHWEELAVYTIGDMHFFNGGTLQLPQTFLMDDQLATALPQDQFALLNLRTKTKEIHKLPGIMLNVFHLEDGRVFCKCKGAILPSTYVSEDKGKTWKNSTFPILSPDKPVFKDGLNGLSLKYEILGGGYITSTNNGGKTWEKTAHILPRLFHKMFYSKDKKMLYAVPMAFPLGGPLWISEDHGKTWRNLTHTYPRKYSEDDK